MADFSTILQTPQIRALVQENILERAFHDALFPRQLFRAEAEPVAWPQGVGDTMVFTGVGLIKPKMRPLTPGQDPSPSTYTSEQWTAILNQYADTLDTHMPSSIAAIASLFLRNSQQLGMSAAQSLDRMVRDRMYNAALSGWTVADGAQTTVTTLRVKRLNGFTRARRPDLAAGSAVKYDTVTGSNPLSITIFDNTGPAEVTRTVTGFTPDTAGDEIGPGTLTLTGGAVTVSDRAYVFSSDRSSLVRVGGGNKVDNVSAGSILRLADLRSAAARFQQQNIPQQADGRYHLHLDPVSVSQLYSDPEFQRLNTSLPDYVIYRDFALGEMFGLVFFRNNECPQVDNVDGASTAAYSQDDPFAGEMFNTGASTGVRVHRPLLVGQGGVYEYYQDLSALITEVGTGGKVGEPAVSNNGIEVITDRIQMLIRQPLNRLGDMVATSWKFIGDWPVRTDGAVGDAARFKRVQVIEHGE